MKINILDKQLANMIAAGEVVERPASAVKELIENSVDANAKNIVVEIKNGGMTYIRVTDDGDGILPEDAVTAFSRHATSKIATREDLEKICTLGFRGEALASIAAVSRTEMFTKTRDNSLGKNVVFEGGELIENTEAGCPDGTTIIIRNLFFNTPARMKFLKNDAAETTAVTEVVNKMILCHPDVSIKFISNGRTVVTSHGTGKVLDCIHTVYGDNYAKNMIDVKYKEEYIKVTGCTGAFSLSRKDRRHQVFFLNGRNIVNRTISTAVSEAYRNSVMVGKFPVCVLYIDIAPGLVDVNVHPTKMEVRFSNDKKIYSAVYWAVKEALTQTTHIPEIEDKAMFTVKDDIANTFCAAPQTEFSVSTHNREGDNAGGSVRDKIRENIIKSEEARSLPGHTPSGGYFRQEIKSISGAITVSSADTSADGVGEISDKPMHTSGPVSASVTADPAKKPVEKITEETLAKESNTTETDVGVPSTDRAETKTTESVSEINFTVVGQVFDTYIIAQSGEDMLLIDQHAAHERIWFEELMANWQNGKISPQSLLIPIVISLDGQDFNTACDNKDFFAEIGFEIDVFGDKDIAVRKVPMEASDDVLRETVAEIIDILDKNSAKPKHELYEKTLHTVACKKAIKGGKPLVVSEMEHLVRKVMELEGINTCPHGRPICVRMSKTALEKQFKRIV